MQQLQEEDQKHKRKVEGFHIPNGPIRQHEDPQFADNQNRNWGRNFVFCFGDDGQPRICIGPHCNYALLPINTFPQAMISGVVWFLFKETMQAKAIVPGIVILFLGIVEYTAFFSTALANPGYVSQPRSLRPDLENQIDQPDFCRKCNCYMSTHGIHHCYSCDICIEGHDHHCVWTGKCIGKGNLCCFYFFLCWTFFALIVGFFMTTVTTSHAQK